MTTLEAPHGEADKIADEPNHIVPKHAWDSGFVTIVRPVDFMGLSDRTCRWPLFEGYEPFYEKFYCGISPIAGSPYCAAHADIAFTPASPRRSGVLSKAAE
jgi:hypothetical protein